MQASTLFKPAYNYLLFTAIVLVVASFFTHGMNDFHWHDTYIVISDQIYFLLIAIIFIFIWGIYYLLRNVLLAKWLTWLHVLSTVGLIIALSTASFWYNSEVLPKRRVRYYNDFEEDNKRLAIVFIPLIIVFFAGQLAFFINTIGGAIKYAVNKSR